MIQADVPKYIEQFQKFIVPYVDETMTTIVTYVEFARDSVYGQLVEKKLKEMLEVLNLKFNEVMRLINLNLDEVMKFLNLKLEEVVKAYPEEFKAVQDFFNVYYDICVRYITWAVTTVVEYPAVQKAIQYITTLTPEKAQAPLEVVKKFAISTFNQVEDTFTEFMATIPTELPAIIKMHFPEVIITFLTSILAYFN